MKGFKNCYYNQFNKEILLKEQGDNTWKKFKYKPWCYISSTDESKTVANDIYKHPLMRYDYNKNEDLAGLKETGLIIAESDLRPEVKFMHERYDNEDLQVDINDWNICLFDIEVAGSSKFYDDTLIEIRSLDGKIHDKVELLTFDLNYDKTKYEVFDIEQNIWIKYTNSCFVSYEFPAPEKANWPINLITCISSKTNQKYTWGLKPYTDTKEPIQNYTYCKTEIDLIDNWTKWFSKQNFDIISGWNSISYDIPYIINRCNKLRQLFGVTKEWECKLSPFGKLPIKHEIKDRKLEGVDLGATFDIPGLYSIDYMELYKTFGNHPPMPSYSLNYVSNFELKDAKLEYDGSINETYKHDWNNFVKYNIKDVVLLERLEKKNKLFPLIIEYAFDCIVTLDKVSNKVPTTTGYALKYLHSTGRVLNDKQSKFEDWWTKDNCYKVIDKNGKTYYQNTEWEDDNDDFKKYLILDRFHNGERSDNIKEDIKATWKPVTNKKLNKTFSSLDVFKNVYSDFIKWPHPFEEFHVKAGYCYDYPGRFDDCMSFDITSSYPHHIMMFNISPETVVKHPTKEQIESGEVILSDVNEVGFLRTTDAILPNIVKKVFAERKIWKKKEGEAIEAGNTEEAGLYHNRQMTKKLIINSVYGVSLATGFHLYNPDCARAICRCARVTLRDWLSRYCNEYYVSKQLIKDTEKYFNIKLKNREPLKITNRDASIIHNDTDSSYICIHELRQRLIDEGLFSNRKTKKYLTSKDGMSDEEIQKLAIKNAEIFKYNEDVEQEYRNFFDTAEKMFQDFFDKVLQIRADKSKAEQLIKYNRENEFKNMFCFAKKLYIGNIIDSEGEIYPFESIKNVPLTDEIKENLPKKYVKHSSGQKHKIMGVPIKKSTMPDFCKEAAEELAFDICSGIDKETADNFIIETYDKYCNSDINIISAVIGITNYKKYIPHDIDYYVKNGLLIDKGNNASVIFAAKASLIYNYILATKKLKLNPINNNTKMKYIYVKPDNEFKYKDLNQPKLGWQPVTFISYLEKWPSEFNNYFKIDYETMFRKSFCALFESMYKILKWIDKKDQLQIEKNELDSIFC